MGGGWGNSFLEALQVCSSLGRAGPSLQREVGWGLSGLESEPGTQSHGHVRAKETEDEGRTGVQRGGRRHRVIKCRPSAAWWPWASVQTCFLPRRLREAGAALAGAGRRGEA